ncbi:MAG TPA: [FeFe] hydrogenase H-cluster radical SAM maturase HydG [Candidatus Omnitrophota bacterium]|nr:[FeFe] hydrogenase H-cluster radical SAM maturase HydG [Candidatus Omnitrophota bacterium]
MLTKNFTQQDWVRDRVQEQARCPYVQTGRDFIPGQEILCHLEAHRSPDAGRVKAILQKSLAVQNLTPEETAVLLQVDDDGLLAEMRETALKVKLKVYDNRIVTFAPLYMGNYCVNNCVYCGFKASNLSTRRRVLSEEEIRQEIAVLAGEIGHKRLVVVYGEHPANDVDYIVDSIRGIYDVRIQRQGKEAGIRRVNVNAPSFSVEDLKKIKDVGLGTYQVFQETYHRPTFERVHPQDTIKGHYLWRLYSMHRAFDAGIDDVGIGVLFGLYDWKYEVMALVYHALELERCFGIGPHTVSFPRLEPALNTPSCENNPHRVDDKDFLKLITVLRLAIPYTGMIVTAREPAPIRRAAVSCGVTQLDASSKIGVGDYGEGIRSQTEDRQQFILGDTRSLDEVIRDLAQMGNITSFCTAGYRCGRTGKSIMELLRKGTEGKFCKLNAILTFKEWLDDFASEETRRVTAPLLARELEQVRRQALPHARLFESYFERIERGERDLYI